MTCRHSPAPARTRPGPLCAALLAAAALLASLTIVGAEAASAQPMSCLGRQVTIFAEVGVPTVGTGGDDVIMGTRGPDVIRGLGGDDRICGLAGADRLVGGGGRDRIHGGAGRDTILGGAGRDILRGGPGNDRIVGHAGDDVCSPGRGRDRVHRCRADGAEASTVVTRLEARMLGHVNRLRRSVGVAPLRADVRLADVARRWSATLPSSFVHNPAVGSQIPSGWRRWGENIGYRVDPFASPMTTMSAIHRRLVASAGHYANLVHPEFTHVGIGIHTQGSGVYVTQVFARY